MSGHQRWRTPFVPSRNPERRFADIVREADLIAEFVAGRSEDVVAQDLKTVRAIERSLQIISEAATKLGDHAETVLPQHPWRQIRDFGNVLRHAYDDVNYDLVWDVIARLLPALREDCAPLSADDSEDSVPPGSGGP